MIELIFYSIKNKIQSFIKNKNKNRLLRVGYDINRDLNRKNLLSLFLSITSYNEGEMKEKWLRYTHRKNKKPITLNLDTL